MITHNPILLKHFEKHGFDDKFFEIYETKAIDEMQNIYEMCDALHRLCEANAVITIYTDFDVDGIMSSVVAYAGLSQLGFNVNLFKPSPSDGYGFRPKDVDDILIEFPETTVILTGDVGITCNEAIVHAQSLGLKVLVTDHHTGSEACAADLTVNPNQLGETYSHNYICGSYVLYKILELYAKLHCSSALQADIYRLQMFAGIATVSDVMPLIYENRELVRNSVSLMRYFYSYELCPENTLAPPLYSDMYMRPFVGMKKLLEYFAFKKKIKKTEDIDEQFYSFYLVPLLNSCKRMDGDMRGVYDIFFSKHVYPLDGFENMSCVENGIKYLDVLNTRRKELTDEHFNNLLDERIKEETENSVFMQSEVYVTTATAGLCGLLASKFMSMSGLPTLVVVQMEDGSYVGSGRNPGWFDFRNETAKHVSGMSTAGHKEAFGVSFADKTALIKYVNFFEDVVLGTYERLISEGAFASDTSISISDLNCTACDFNADTLLIKDFLCEKQRFHPFGQAFPEPQFSFNINLNNIESKMFGSDNQHIKLITRDGIEILLFGLALDFEKIKFDYADKDFILTCYGTFRFDDYEPEFDTLNFFANEIKASEVAL